MSTAARASQARSTTPADPLSRAAPPEALSRSPALSSSSFASEPGESRVLLAGIGWAGFETIATLRGERSTPRLTYVDGDLELMSPSYQHELLTGRLSLFVIMMARGLGMTCLDAGSTLWRRQERDRGKEPDACFYLANEPQVRGLTEIDLAIQPPPDLAIEVEITHPLTNALHVYAALGVPEVWRHDGQVLRFFHFQEDGQYVEREWSRNFPALRSWEVSGLLPRADDLGDVAWSFEVENWARDELAHHQPPPPPPEPERTEGEP